MTSLQPHLETLPQGVPPLLDDEPVPHAVSRDVPLPVDRVEIVVVPQAGNVVGAERGGVAAAVAVYARLEAVRGVHVLADGGAALRVESAITILLEGRSFF